MRDYELVRFSSEMLKELLTQDSPPVVILGFDRHEDGTIELVLRRVVVEERGTRP